MQKYFTLINSTYCLNEYYDYLKTIDLNTITDFHMIIPIKN
jgi:hypothetical protein